MTKWQHFRFVKDLLSDILIVWFSALAAYEFTYQGNMPKAQCEILMAIFLYLVAYVPQRKGE